MIPGFNPPIKLSPGFGAFRDIQRILDENPKENYTLSIFDKLTNNTAEIYCSISDMVEIIKYVSSVEHDFPEWIGINDLSNSYVVGMAFTRGRIEVPNYYVWKKNSLVSESW
jgi:hypothetical protein